MLSSTPQTVGVSSSSTASGVTIVPSEVIIRKLNDNVTIFSRPFERGGMHVGVRMSAIKTSKGVVLYNPTELDGETQSALQQIGNVTHIVAPNTVHHVFLDSMAKAYPDAIVVCPEGLKEKHRGISNTILELKESEHYGTSSLNFGDDSIQFSYLPEITHQEILLFHTPSKTLFVGDMLWNLPATEQYQHATLPEHTKKGIMSSIGDDYMKPDGTMHKLFSRLLMKKTDHLDKEMIRIFDVWVPSTVVPQHGDVITTGALDKLRNAWSWAWSEKK